MSGVQSDNGFESSDAVVAGQSFGQGSVMVQ